MVIEAKTLSLWDAGRFYFRVSFPALLLGLVAPNRLFLSWLSRRNAGQSTLRMLKAFREKYRCDHLWFRFIGGRTLLVLNPETMRAVLESPDNQSDPVLKKSALSKLVPDGLIISGPEEWPDRRKFNQTVLDFGHLHRYCDAFKEIAFREVGQSGIQARPDWRWANFQVLGQNISQQVVLGSGHVEPEMATQLASMVKGANWCLPSSKFAAFYQRVESCLSQHRASIDSADRAQQTDAKPATARCLMHDSASLLESGSTTSSTRISDQIGFWLFVLKDAVELHVARTLALIAAHPEVQERLRQEIGSVATLTAQAIDGLQYLEGCIREQLRLWTPVPTLLRRAIRDFSLHGEIAIKADQQILMLPGLYHRDPGVFGQLADRFSPESVTGLPPVYYFSHGRQSCAGQFLARFLIKTTLAALLVNARFELVRPQIDPGRVPYLYDHFEIELRAVRDA